jgi:putative toxin-antitoxin system antitoxin component (TIGR02293 family)
MNKPKPYIFIEDDPSNLTSMVREGMPFPYFTKLSDQIHLGFEEWSSYLHLSERTIQRYKKENKSFESLYAERILQIELLYKKGVKVFGLADNFYTWMESISIALGGVKPKALLDTFFGIQQVHDELNRIEHGVLA